jgi:hypothetical protein
MVAESAVCVRVWVGSLARFRYTYAHSHPDTHTQAKEQRKGAPTEEEFAQGVCWLVKDGQWRRGSDARVRGYHTKLGVVLW